MQSMYGQEAWALWGEVAPSSLKRLSLWKPQDWQNQEHAGAVGKASDKQGFGHKGF